MTRREDITADDNKRLIGYVTLTLLYAWKRPPSPFDVEGKIAAVEAYLASKGGS